MTIDFRKYPFPKKLRHHTSSNFYFAAEGQKDVPHHYPPVIEKMDWKIYFRDGQPPAALDAGCGKGTFLIRYALENPGENILGLELRRILVEWVKEVAGAEGIGNCSAEYYSIVNGLNFIETGSLGRVFYLFPDPWHKRRHHKRRAFDEEMASEFHRVLKPGGILYLATDVPQVDEYQRKVLEKSGNFELKYIETSDEWGIPTTNQEEFCLRKKIPFVRLKCTAK